MKMLLFALHLLACNLFCERSLGLSDSQTLAFLETGYFLTATPICWTCHNCQFQFSTHYLHSNGRTKWLCMYYSGTIQGRRFVRMFVHFIYLWKRNALNALIHSRRLLWVTMWSQNDSLIHTRGYSVIFTTHPKQTVFTVRDVYQTNTQKRRLETVCGQRKKHLNVKRSLSHVCRVNTTLLLLSFAMLLKRIQWFFLSEYARNKGVIGFSRTEKALKIETRRSRYCFRVHSWQIYIYESGTLSQRLSLSRSFSLCPPEETKKLPSINAHYNQMFDRPARV